MAEHICTVCELPWTVAAVGPVPHTSDAHCLSLLRAHVRELEAQLAAEVDHSNGLAAQRDAAEAQLAARDAEITTLREDNERLTRAVNAHDWEARIVEATENGLRLERENAELRAQVAARDGLILEHGVLPAVGEDALCPDCDAFVEWRDDDPPERGVCDPCAAARLAVLTGQWAGLQRNPATARLTRRLAALEREHTFCTTGTRCLICERQPVRLGERIDHAIECPVLAVEQMERA